jgi:hypothetical protein
MKHRETPHIFPRTDQIFFLNDSSGSLSATVFFSRIYENISNFNKYIYFNKYMTVFISKDSTGITFQKSILQFFTLLENFFIKWRKNI